MRRSGLFSGLARSRALFAALCVGALVFAACGGDDDDDDAATDTTEADDTTEETTAEGDDDGASAEPVKIGVLYIDFGAIADFVDFTHGDQKAIATALIDDINANGGAGGHQLEPVFLEYPPLPGAEPSPQAICTTMTDDEQVFAVLGGFIDFTGEGQLCLTRDNDTVHIGHELQAPWIEEAQPALLLTPGGTPDATAGNLITLLGDEGTLEGKTVAVLGDNNTQNRIDDVITPGLEEIGAETGTTAVLTISGTDTTAAQAQLDGAIEVWKGEGVDTIFMAGLNISSKQFVDKIAAEIPGVLLLADSGSVVEQGQDAAAAGADPNPYEGMLTIEGQTRSERWAAPNEKLQHCIDVVEEATGEAVLGPDEVTPGADGKTVESYVAVEDFCDLLDILALGLEGAGAEVNTDTWRDSIHGLGVIVLPTANIASFCEGKYTGGDEFRLVAFDSTIGENGDWSGVTELADASGGKCA